MSNVQKPCNPIAGSEAVLKAYDDCNLEFDLAISDLPNITLVDVQAAIEASPTIANMKAKDTQLQNQINNVKSTDISNIQNSVSENTAEITAIKSKDDDQDAVITELSENIAMLKNWNVKQDASIKSANRNVIVDETYNNFQERVENVYLANSEDPVNKYNRWDFYLNTNPSIDATNATYINKRSPNATSALSANDWELLKYAAPADVITIAGLNPIEVVHSSQHVWTVSINEDKFKTFLAWLDKVTLNDLEVSKISLPTSANITIDGVDFESWLVEFWNQHWQQI